MPTIDELLNEALVMQGKAPIVTKNPKYNHKWYRWFEVGKPPFEAFGKDGDKLPIQWLAPQQGGNAGRYILASVEYLSTELPKMAGGEYRWFGEASFATIKDTNDFIEIDPPTT